MKLNPVMILCLLLLGNWRSSLVISSIIPLSLLFTLGLMNGFAIVALAILFDRASQAYARRTNAHLGGFKHD